MNLIINEVRYLLDQYDRTRTAYGFSDNNVYDIVMLSFSKPSIPVKSVVVKMIATYVLCAILSIHKKI